MQEYDNFFFINTKVLIESTTFCNGYKVVKYM